MYIHSGICLCRHCARSAKRILAPSHQLCQQCTGKSLPYPALTSFTSSSPLCRHLLPPSSHLLSNLITTSHSPTFLPGLRPVVRPLRQLTEHCPQAGRSILRFHRIETLHIPHPLNHPHFVYPHYIKATLSQSKQSIRICLL